MALDLYEWVESVGIHIFSFSFLFVERSVASYRRRGPPNGYKEGRFGMLVQKRCRFSMQLDSLE